MGEGGAAEIEPPTPTLPQCPDRVGLGEAGTTNLLQVDDDKDIYETRVPAPMTPQPMAASAQKPTNSMAMEFLG